MMARMNLAGIAFSALLISSAGSCVPTPDDGPADPIEPDASAISGSAPDATSMADGRAPVPDGPARLPADLGGSPPAVDAAGGESGADARGGLPARIDAAVAPRNDAGAADSRPAGKRRGRQRG
jgi:hypothetical protein